MRWSMNFPRTDSAALPRAASAEGLLDCARQGPLGRPRAATAAAAKDTALLFAICTIPLLEKAGEIRRSGSVSHC